MTDEEKKEIKQIIEKRKDAHSYFLKRSKVYKAFTEMEKNTYSDNRLSKKQKELMVEDIYHANFN